MHPSGLSSSRVGMFGKPSSSNNDNDNNNNNNNNNNNKRQLPLPPLGPLATFHCQLRSAAFSASLIDRCDGFPPEPIREEWL